MHWDVNIIFQVLSFYNTCCVVQREKNAVFKFKISILKEYEYCKKVIKRHFNKNLVMSVGENEELKGVIFVGFVVN